MDLKQVRTLCLSFPAATEDVKWEHHLVFSVGEKMFCMTNFEPPFACSLKVRDEEFEELSTRNGLAPAAYMARAKWIAVSKSSAFSKEEWRHYLRQSYELVKGRLTKKRRSELGL